MAIQVEYIQPGTKVFTVFVNKIEEYKITNVHIDIKEDVPVSYSLENCLSKQTTKLNSSVVFETIKELKENILDQFKQLEKQEKDEKS